MKYRHILTVIGLCFLNSAVAQERETPESLVGFLAPGTKVGITEIRDSDRIAIHVFEGDDFLIAADARTLDLDGLAKKYEPVSTARTKLLGQLDPSKFGADPQVLLHVDRRELLCTVIATGNDYVLVAFGPDNSQRRAYPTNRINSIGFGLVNWYGRFHVPRPDETSPPK